MPTYEYRCKACGLELDVVQSFTDDSLTTCEACGGQLRKVFGNVGIAFKGSGFYKNDSRGKPASTAASTDRGGEAGGATKDAGSGTTADSAPAPTSTPAPKADKADKAPKADKAKTGSTTS